MRAPHVPTDKQREQVELLARWGVRVQDIAAQIGIELSTLYRYYHDELDRGVAHAAEELTRTAYRRAMDGDTKMLIFLLRARFGYRDIQRVECTGIDGAPIQTQQAIRVTFVRPHKRAGRPKKDA